MTDPFAMIESVLAGMTPGPWQANAYACECCAEVKPDITYAADGFACVAIPDAAGIALLRNLAPLMLDVCKEAYLRHPDEDNPLGNALRALKAELEKPSCGT